MDAETLLMWTTAALALSWVALPENWAGFAAEMDKYLRGDRRLSRAEAEVMSERLAIIVIGYDAGRNPEAN